METLHDNHVLDRRRALQRIVRDLLQRDNRPSAPPSVGGDEHVALRIVDAIAQRISTEPTENHGVRGAEPGAGEHRDRELGNQRKVDRDAIAAPNAKRLQHVCELANLAVQIEVRQRPPLARLAFPDERRLVAARPAHVSIDAVDARVNRSADEPLRMRRRPLEHLRPRREPFELRCERCPERFRVLVGARVDICIVDIGLRAEFFRRWKAAIFLEEVGYLSRWSLVGHGAFPSRGDSMRFPSARVRPTSPRRGVRQAQRTASQ
jgi:hypothetical protein